MLTVVLNGAAKTVTGSLHFLEYKGKSESENTCFCVDAGMFQTGENINLNELNSRFLFDPKELDAIILTHAHLDHCGRIPLLVKQGFSGKIYATSATRDLAEIVMTDAARQQFNRGVDLEIEKAEEISRKLGFEDIDQETCGKLVENHDEPLYSSKEVDKAMKLFEVYDYKKEFKLNNNLKGVFHDAGHILGSAWVLLEELSTGKKVAFSGDLGNLDKPILRDLEFMKNENSVTHVFTETTYGDRVHGEMKPKDKLKKIARKTFSRGGKLLIPSFSVERAQEVIYFLTELMSEGKISRRKIYLDSPMAQAVNQVMVNHTDLYDKEMKLKLLTGNPFEDENLFILETTDESKTLNYNKESCVIIAGSGMVTGGRIIKHLKFHIEDRKNTLLFVGFQAEGTPGREILDGARKITLDGVDRKVLAETEIVREFSAHADQTLLKKWVDSLISDRVFREGKKTQVVLTHGEVESMESFSKILKESYPDNNLKVSIPNFGEKLTIW